MRTDNPISKQNNLKNYKNQPQLSRKKRLKCNKRGVSIKNQKAKRRLKLKEKNQDKKITYHKTNKLKIRKRNQILHTNLLDSKKQKLNLNKKRNRKRKESRNKITSRKK